MRRRTWKFWAALAVVVTILILVLKNTLEFLTVTGIVDPTITESLPEAHSSAPEAPAVPTLPAGTVNDIDFKAYSQDLAKHIGLEQGETRLDSIDKIRLYFAPEPGTNMVNLSSSTVERDDGSVMLFARHDLPDNSVFAEEVYAVFSGPGETNKFNQSLEAYGLRLKCRRGDNKMEWTTELCP